MNTVFSICFNSIHLPLNNIYDSPLNELSSDSQKLLIEFNDELNRRMLTSKYADITAVQLDGSIFGICVPDGYVLLKCSANASKRSVSMDGFFLRSDESLRTAWMMTRWQMLFICSAGWSRDGKVWLTPEEVTVLADAVKLPVQNQSHIIELGKAMLQSDHPYNFALTDYMKSRLPLVFCDQAEFQENMISPEEKDSIILDLTQVHAIRNKVAMSSEYKSVVLLRCSSKTFVNYKLAEARSASERNRWKAEFKTLFKNINYVWCIRVIKEDKSYTEYIAEYLSVYLDKSCIDYNNMDYLLKYAKRNAQRFFESDLATENESVDKNTLLNKIFKKH